MPGLCMSRAAARVSIRGCLSFQQYKKDANFMRTEEESELISHEIIDLSMNKYLPESECGNRVMVVVDSDHEAEGALEWALSHTVQNRGVIILLHVASKGTCFYVSQNLLGSKEGHASSKVVHLS